jgi:hypothetical protein
MPKPKRLVLYLEAQLIPLLWIRNLPNLAGIKNPILSEPQARRYPYQIKLSVRFYDSKAPFSIGIDRRMKASSLVNKSILRICM